MGVDRFLRGLPVYFDVRRHTLADTIRFST